jgi:hypothetical protein
VEVFAQLADIKQLWIDEANQLLESDRVKQLWETNRPRLIILLQKYGLVASKEMIEMVQEAEDLEALRPVIIEAAMAGADWTMEAMKPIIKLQQDGDVNIFEGFDFATDGRGDWNTNDNRALVAKLKTAGEHDVGGNRRRQGLLNTQRILESPQGLL